MLTFREFLKEQLKDPEFKKEWDALAPEREETLKQLRAENEKRLRKTKCNSCNDLVRLKNSY